MSAPVAFELETIGHRFWPKVDKAGPIVRADLGNCWVWTGARKKDPRRGLYGRFILDGKVRGAHQISFLLATSRWPAGLVLHKCDNAPCVNPAHLYEGTSQQNIDDAKRRGRLRSVGAPPGEANPSARLRTEDVLAIRERYARGDISMRALAKELGLYLSHVRDIVQMRTWQTVPAPAVVTPRPPSSALTLNGETMTMTEWAHRLGTTCGVLYMRKKAGWSDERTLTQPVRKRVRRKW